jgi:hypothetical protein
MHEYLQLENTCKLQRRKINFYCFKQSPIIGMFTWGTIYKYMSKRQFQRKRKKMRYNFTWKKYKMLSIYGMKFV